MMDFTRYNRQLLLPGFGEEKQNLLADAKVLVIGAGGLGCPILMYLTAAGVGTLGIIDGDVVELSNLHRQVLFSEQDMGQSKALVAAKKLKQQNQQVKFKSFDFPLTPKNAADIIRQYDLVIDGSDNFPTRYLVNDTCVLLDKPLIYGSIYRFEGQVAVFNMKDQNGIKTNYRDLFPEPPDASQVPNCAEAGVLGVLPGLIGSMQANEAIKVITGIGKPLVNQLLTYNSLNNATYTLAIFPNEKSAALIPKNLQSLAEKNYEVFCGYTQVRNISARELEIFMESQNNIRLLDVRESFEMPKMDKYPYKSIPLSQLKNRMGELDPDQQYLIFCQSGKRSLQATDLIAKKENSIKIYNLQGGMNEWISFQNQKK